MGLEGGNGEWKGRGGEREGLLIEMEWVRRRQVHGGEREICWQC